MYVIRVFEMDFKFNFLNLIQFNLKWIPRLWCMEVVKILFF